mmetsp:Transcript_996/g.2083  ORF Transcript_996/g.2083 Transcript_996/m.2083 type:complete len:203 (-) Transcript_996:1295-1903(-)
MRVLAELGDAMREHHKVLQPLKVLLQVVLHANLRVERVDAVAVVLRLDNGGCEHGPVAGQGPFSHPLLEIGVGDPFLLPAVPEPLLPQAEEALLQLPEAKGLRDHVVGVEIVPVDHCLKHALAGNEMLSPHSLRSPRQFPCVVFDQPLPFLLARIGIQTCPCEQQTVGSAAGRGRRTRNNVAAVCKGNLTRRLLYSRSAMRV